MPWIARKKNLSHSRLEKSARERDTFFFGLARNVVPILSVLAILGSALYSLTANMTDGVLAAYAGKRVTVEGVIVRDPEVRETSIRLNVAPGRVNGVPVVDSKNIIVSVDRFVEARYGDRVTARGVLKTPEVFDTDSGRTFNYPSFLWAHGVSHTMSFAEISITEHNAGNPLVASLLSIKHALVTGIERALPEPYAALAEGLLLGEKQSLGKRLYDAFVASGVVHIIVLSGYNVSLVIESVLFVALRVLPRLLGYALAAVFVVGFAVATGGSETTVRATIMALLMMVARVLHRPALALRGLLIAAALMALVNPFLVLYDLSFQLSVVATLGLILFSSGIARRIPFVSERLGFREIVATTLATQVTVLPLLILSLGTVSLVFLPANALVLPAVPLAMLLSFIAALVALVLPFAGIVAALPAYLVLSYIVSIPEFFGTLPFSAITIPPGMSWVALSLLGVVYACTAFAIMRRGIWKRLLHRSGS